MLIANGEIKTSSAQSCDYNSITNKWDISYRSGKVYSYHYLNVRYLKDPVLLDSRKYKISRGNQQFHHVEEIYEFSDENERYWHLIFENGTEGDYNVRDLVIEESCLLNLYAKNVFSYLKEIAKLSDIRIPEDNERLLPKRYDTIGFVGSDIVLSRYLGIHKVIKPGRKEYIPVFPFGCNNSQYLAVKRAMENQLSVIQGPPGTGKTQTILNIIANILMQGKTVQVVSNNNSAIENVFEKLASPKYGLGFLVAALGRSDKKKKFVQDQADKYPDLTEWKLSGDNVISLESIKDKSENLKKIFDYEERRAIRKQELNDLELEMKYFKEYLGETNVTVYDMELKNRIKSEELMKLWQTCQGYADSGKPIHLWFKLKNYVQYGIGGKRFYKKNISEIITTFQWFFYQYRLKELCDELSALSDFLDKSNSNLMQRMCEESMLLLKDMLAVKYQGRKRQKLSEQDLWKNPWKVIDEYPIVLSTTFSSKTSLGKDMVFDYLIMDEASQVDIATGALALSCARNAIIVGDTKQLPNVVPQDVKQRAEVVFQSYKIAEGYQYSNSFLQSVLKVVPEVPQTLLREHYRCHPKIIDFCNQKFYNGELVIMTRDNGETDVLKVIKTASGSHTRGHYSQRQIDVIKNEIIPQYIQNKQETGIIAPYRDQVTALKQDVLDIEVDTVHKFQGREKDNIIISTVDDQISDFVDDPYLLNVAVSRAKKRLMLVVSGNEQRSDGNICDLISYIQYHNFEIVESQIYSVFDYLYRQYTMARKEYLHAHKKISEYDSENLIYAMISDIMLEENLTTLETVCHFPLNMLIRDLKLLNEEECKYVMNPATHVDFLIFNRVSKQPILAIEVDGYDFHKHGTLQAERDVRKNHILEMYGIPLLRLSTNGSGEKEKLVKSLNMHL